MHKQKFFDYLIFEKRFSSHTIKAYQTDIDQFYDFIDQNYGKVGIQEISYQFIRSWIVELLTNQSISPNSTNRKISSLKSYFKFLTKNKYVSKNPMLKIISPKKTGVLPSFVDVKGMNQLFDSSMFENSFEGARDSLLLLLLYQTGIRLSELIGIELNDIDYIKNEVKVLGKRNKERILPLTGEVVDSLHHYLSHRSQIVNIESKNLLITEKGKTIYPKLVYNRVNHYLSLVTTLKKKSPHVLRHTFATHMLNNGADLNTIKELLGHSSLAATQVYTHNSFEKIKSIYNTAHPRA